MSRFNLYLSFDEYEVEKASVHWLPILGWTIVTVLLGDFYIIGLYFVIRAIIRLTTTHLYLTNKNLKGKIGFLRTHEMDLPLSKITAVSVDQKLLGKILGYGNIYISSASDNFYYKNIKLPSDFKIAVIDEIDQYNENRITKQAESLARIMNNNM